MEHRRSAKVALQQPEPRPHAGYSAVCSCAGSGAGRRVVRASVARFTLNGLQSALKLKQHSDAHPLLLVRLWQPEYAVNEKIDHREEH